MPDLPEGLKARNVIRQALRDGLTTADEVFKAQVEALKSGRPEDGWKWVEQAEIKFAAQLPQRGEEREG